MTLFNNTGQHFNFTQAPGSINHLWLMAHQARTGWFRGKHQDCHQHGALPSVTVSLWSSACDHLSHPHTLTCKSVTATGDVQQSTTSSSWKVPPAQELGELPTCTRVSPGLSLVARIYPGVHGHRHQRSTESRWIGSCCPCRDGTRAMPSQCLSMNRWPYLRRPLEALECQLPFWKGVESLLK